MNQKILRRWALLPGVLLLLTSVSILLPAQAPYRARVSIKRVIPDVANAWPPGIPAVWMSLTNVIYAKTGLQFDLIEVVDFVPVSPNNWFTVNPNNLTAMENEAKATPANFGWRDDAINVYLVQDIVGVGGVCSFANYNPTQHKEIIVIAPDILDGAGGLAHELGHYFDLPHTFETAFGVESAATCSSPLNAPEFAANGMTAGDQIADTAGDPNDLAQVLGLYAATCPSTLGAVLNNVMSYYSASVTNKVFTSGQAHRMLETALGGAGSNRLHVMQPFSQDFTKVMLTEVYWELVDWCEITNFDTVPRDLSGWTIEWTSYRTRLKSSPLNITLQPGESAIIKESGTVSGVFPGVQVVTAFPPLTQANSLETTVTLFDNTERAVDTVRIPKEGATTLAPRGGGYFVGSAPRDPFAVGVERIWNLDSDSGTDWVTAYVPTPGRENTTEGTRGTDPRPTLNVKITEADDTPDLIELRNYGNDPVDLCGCQLHCPADNNTTSAFIFPWPSSHMVAGNGFTVLGESTTPPSEMPSSTPYVNVSALGFNIPWYSEEYACFLYDRYGRVLDGFRTTGIDDTRVQNHPRSPSHWQDFLGAAGRKGFGEQVVGRIGSGTDTNKGSDFYPLGVRTMGLPNPSSATTGGPGDGTPLDVRLNDTASPGGLAMILNAGPAYAGYIYATAFSFGHSNGVGPLLGLGPDATNNFIILGTQPPFAGTLNSQGSVRIDAPGGFLGLQSDNILILQQPGGPIISLTKVIEFDG